MSITILSPGTLELYALDTLSANERAAIEQDIADNPDLQQELRNIENDLEQFAAAQARNPSPTVRTRIMSEIKAKTETATPQAVTPVTPRSASPVIYTMAVAASIAILAAITFFNKWNGELANIQALQKENDKLAAMIDAETEKRFIGEDFLNTLKSTNITVIKAVAGNGEVKGQLYWNRAENQAIFVSSEPAGRLVASVSDANSKSDINITSNDNLSQFYKFSLPETADSLRLADASDATKSFGEVNIILRQRKVVPKPITVNEPSLPKTGL